jgi:hypothetical protein
MLPSVMGGPGWDRGRVFMPGRIPRRRVGRKAAGLPAGRTKGRRSCLYRRDQRQPAIVLPLVRQQVLRAQPIDPRGDAHRLWRASREGRSSPRKAGAARDHPGRPIGRAGSPAHALNVPRQCGPTMWRAATAAVCGFGGTVGGWRSRRGGGLPHLVRAAICTVLGMGPPWRLSAAAIADIDESRSFCAVQLTGHNGSKLLGERFSTVSPRILPAIGGAAPGDPPAPHSR